MSTILSNELPVIVLLFVVFSLFLKQLDVHVITEQYYNIIRIKYRNVTLLNKNDKV